MALSCSRKFDFLDLCVLAGLQPAAVICELVREQDGLMARRDDCAAFAKEHGFKFITIAALVDYIKQTRHQNGDFIEGKKL
jgi:3,4-dihydroxy-2-butanone 4-phosphate synthase